MTERLNADTVVMTDEQIALLRNALGYLDGTKLMGGRPLRPEEQIAAALAAIEEVLAQIDGQEGGSDA